MKDMFVGLVFGMGLTACGGAPVPHDQLTAAQASVSAAKTGGAENEPQAALHLKKAQDQIAQAKALIEDDENESAELLLKRAEVDAEMALSLAREASMKAEAEAARIELEKLRAQLAPGQK